GTEAAAVVPVGAGEEPEVPGLTQHRVPHAAEYPGVAAGAAERRAADGVGRDAVDGLAQDLVLAAVRRGAVARLRFHAERDRRRGVVEVAQVLDVEPIVAVRVELAGALEVGGNVVALVRRMLL